MEQIEKNKTELLCFVKPEIRVIRFDMKDILTTSGTEEPTDATDPNQGVWI